EHSAPLDDCFGRKLIPAVFIDTDGSLNAGGRIDGAEYDRAARSGAGRTRHSKDRERNEWCEFLHRSHLICKMFATMCVTPDDIHVPLSRRCHPRSSPAAKSIGRMPSPYVGMWISAKSAAVPTIARPSLRVASHPYTNRR